MTASISSEAGDNAISNDLLEGAGAIAAFTGKTVRQANYLLETGQLPAFKIGRLWHMRRSTFMQFIEQQEAAAKLANAS